MRTAKENIIQKDTCTPHFAVKALFTTASDIEATGMSITTEKSLKNMQYIYPVEYYSAM